MEEKNIKIIKEILEWAVCIIIAVIIAIAFRYFIGTPTIVQQSSMDPTLKEGQRLWLNRWARTTGSIPNRGDIITLEAPSQEHLNLSQEDVEESVVARYDDNLHSGWETFLYHVLEVNKKSYIKRVIGLPGEHIMIKNGYVYINDEFLDEEYLPSGIVTDSFGGACTDLVVPEDCIFVMGDNRTASVDSRRFGCVPLKKVESVVGIRIWPLNLFGKIDK